MHRSRSLRPAARRAAVSAMVVGALVASALAVAAPAEAATSLAKLTVSGSHSIVSGVTRTLSMTAPSTAKGATVRFQIGTGSKWSTLTAKRANTKGDASVTLRLTGVGAVRYRAQILKTKHFKATVTSSVLVTISKWFCLADMTVISQGLLGVSDEQADLAGIAYPHAVKDFLADEWRNHGYASYNLAYHCSRFETTVGPNDDDAVTVPALDTVLIDGVSVGSFSTTLGHPAHDDLDVTDGFRITIDDVWDHSSSKAYASGNVVWGDARVLCTSNVAATR